MWTSGSLSTEATLLLAIFALAALRLTWLLWSALTRKKLLLVRRVGDRTGVPIAARSWHDVTGVFPGQSPRIYVHPSGDEVVDGAGLFDVLPDGQILYVAANGEDFIPADSLEAMGMETKRSQEAIYSSVVEKIFQQSLLPRTDGTSLSDYANQGVRAYLETRLHVSTAFAQFSQ